MNRGWSPQIRLFSLALDILSPIQNISDHREGMILAQITVLPDSSLEDEILTRTEEPACRSMKIHR